MTKYYLNNAIHIILQDVVKQTYFLALQFDIKQLFDTFKFKALTVTPVVVGVQKVSDLYENNKWFYTYRVD